MNRVINGGRYMFFDTPRLANETHEEYEVRYQKRLAQHKQWLADEPKREARRKEHEAQRKAELGAMTMNELTLMLCEYVDAADDIDNDAEFVTAILRERVGPIEFTSVELTPKRFTVKP